jgi:hypothetical protein
MKTLDGNALLKAVGAGLVIEFIFITIIRVSNALLGVSYGVIPHPENITPGFTLYNLGSLCSGYLVFALIGAGYGFFAQRNGMLPHAGRMALDGTITLTILGVIGNVVSPIVSLLHDMIGDTLTLAGIPPYDPFRRFVPLMVAAGICISILINSVLGAIGGAVYGLIARGRSRHASATGQPTVE